MKQCIKCYKALPLSSFYKNVTHRDKVQSSCKKCDNKRHILWRKNNPEKVREMSSLQRIRYPDKMRAFVRKYHQEHPEVAKKALKKWAKKNSHKISAHRKVYYALKIGKLKRKKCYCGKVAQAHHEDYSKPLDVKWLCDLHHKARHIKLRCKNTNN